ncbi:Uncharacterised protein [Xylophilus ampelinus]|nr:Uncharacterised protein [Xylophilus ampelinus]
MGRRCSKALESRRAARGRSMDSERPKANEPFVVCLCRISKCRDSARMSTRRRRGGGRRSGCQCLPAQALPEQPDQVARLRHRARGPGDHRAAGLLLSRKIKVVAELPGGASVGIQNAPPNGNRAAAGVGRADHAQDRGGADKTATPLAVTGNPDSGIVTTTALNHCAASLRLPFPPPLGEGRGGGTRRLKKLCLIQRRGAPHPTSPQRGEEQNRTRPRHAGRSRARSRPVVPVCGRRRHSRRRAVPKARRFQASTSVVPHASQREPAPENSAKTQKCNRRQRKPAGRPTP